MEELMCRQTAIFVSRVLVFTTKERHGNTSLCSSGTHLSVLRGLAQMDDKAELVLGVRPYQFLLLLAGALLCVVGY
jgi:hypothetical protein